MENVTSMNTRSYWRTELEKTEYSNDRFYLLFDHMFSGVAIYRVINGGMTGKDYIVLDINKAALKIEGKRAEEVQGKSLLDLRPNIDEYGLIPVFRRVWETGESAYFPHTAFTDKTNHRWYESRVFKLPTGEIVAIYSDVTEKQQMQEKIAEYEERFRQINEAISDMIWMTDRELRLFYVSPSVQKLLGETAEEHMRKTLEQKFPPQSLKLIRTALEAEMRLEQSELSEKNRTRLIELQQYKADGSLTWIAMHISFLRGEQGYATGLLGVSRDISERKSAEQALAHSHALMQYVIEHSLGSVAVHDKELRYLYVSQHYLNEYRITDRDVIGLHHYEVFPDLPQKWRDVHQRALRGEIISAEEDSYVRPDGTTEWTRWECRPWYEQDGSIGGIIVHTEMITERKKAELALQKSERLYQTFINASSDFIYLKDEQLRYMMANDALVRHMGIEHKDMIGRDDFELMSCHNAMSCRESDKRATLENRVIIAEEPIGKRVFESIKFPVSIQTGNTGVGAYIRDITDKKEQQKKILRSVERHKILSELFLRSFSSKQEQLDYALSEAIALTESRHGYICLYHEEKQELEICSWTPGVIMAPHTVKKQQRYHMDQTGFWAEAIRRRKAVVINDFDAPHPGKQGVPQGHAAIRNFLSIPVFKDERIVAVMGLGNKDGDFDDNDVYEMTMLMNGIWMAVEQKEAQRQIEDLLAQTRSMFTEHEAVMLLIDPKTGRIVNANPAASKFYGYSEAELHDMFIGDINMNSAEEVGQLVSDIINKRRNCFTVSHRLKNGESRIVDVYSCPISYNASTVLYSIIFDVTEREKAFENVRHMSRHDHLTGLYNRRYFDEALARVNTEEFLPLTVIMADINGLKLVNDSFGHEEGDRLLTEAARIIRQGCGGDEIIARVGGDEFAILLPNTDEEKAQEVMRNIKHLEEQAGMQPLVMSLSMGYAVRRNSATEMSKTLAEAENFMYRRKMYESASMRSKTIEIVMNTLFEKSSREMEHSKRVGRISAAIASALGLDTGYANQLRTAGTLHDIGKIGIDEKILNKPGRLDEKEWEELKKHPEAGWRILSNSDEFSEVANFIRHHHERWDGRGYPEGLKGEQIPLQSRIIAVADAYDAMTQDRSYRKGMSKQQALQELTDNAGNQFDSDIVSIFADKVYPNL